MGRDSRIEIGNERKTISNGCTFTSFFSFQSNWMVRFEIIVPNESNIFKKHARNPCNIYVRPQPRNHPKNPIDRSPLGTRRWFSIICKCFFWKWASLHDAIDPKISLRLAYRTIERIRGATAFQWTEFKLWLQRVPERVEWGGLSIGLALTN